MQRRFIAPLRSVIPFVLLLSSSMSLAGCYHTRISHADAWAAATEVERQTVWSFFWGLKQQNIEPAACHGDGLAEVTVSRDLGHALISVVTLGMVVPVRIEWRCNKQVHAEDDDF